MPLVPILSLSIPHLILVMNAVVSEMRGIVFFCPLVFGPSDVLLGWYGLTVPCVGGGVLVCDCVMGQIVGCACPVSDEWTELAENFVAVWLVKPFST